MIKNPLLERTLIVEAPHAQDRNVRPVRGALTVLTGSSMGSVAFITKAQTVVGRDETSDLQLSDPGVSRAHACFHHVGVQYAVEDLGSSNGTFVDSGRVRGRHPIREGERIWLGSTLLRFSLQDEVEQAASQRMYDMSVRDGLTGLFNRRHLDERLAGELAFALRHGTALALILVDIDFFKRVNDTWGHQAGDMVLQRVAEVLGRCVRAEDIVARFGGEEFAVVARGIDATGANAFAERIRTTVAATSILCDGQPLEITVSLGLTHNHRGAPVSKPAAMLAAADQALYAAKHGGRNRVCVASSPGSYSSADGDRPAKPRDRTRTWEVNTAPASLKDGAAPSTIVGEREKR